MTPGPKQVRIAGGRIVGLWEYGDPDGFPVLAFHGTPSCGLGFGVADAAATQLGVRLLAPDRPGVGKSTPSPAWTVSSYVDQLPELADALGLDRFAVWGYSGGGPYAVACAALLSERTTAAAVTAGMGEIGVWARPGDFDAMDRLMTWLAVRQPRVAQLLMIGAGRLVRLQPAPAVRGYVKQLSAADREFLQSDLSIEDRVAATFTEAVRYGAAGVVADYAATSGPWKLDLGRIAVPLLIWHGDQDATVPLAHSQALARRVPTSTLTVWSGTGHLGPLVNAGEILTGLLNHQSA